LKRAEGEGVRPREDNSEKERGKKKGQPVKDYKRIEKKIKEGDEPKGREQAREKTIDFIFIINFQPWIHMPICRLQIHNYSHNSITSHYVTIHNFPLHYTLITTSISMSNQLHLGIMVLLLKCQNKITKKRFKNAFPLLIPNMIIRTSKI